MNGLHHCCNRGREKQTVFRLPGHSLSQSRRQPVNLPQHRSIVLLLPVQTPSNPAALHCTQRAKKKKKKKKQLLTHQPASCTCFQIILRCKKLYFSPTSRILILCVCLCVLARPISPPRRANIQM